MPQDGKIWMKEVDYLPRTLWSVAKNGEVTRLKLARMNNWKESDPNDVMSEWPSGKTRVGGKTIIRVTR
jgi:hypothetical protein